MIALDLEKRLFVRHCEERVFERRGNLSYFILK